MKHSLAILGLGLGLALAASAANLTHRYSFDYDYSDSIGAATGIPVGSVPVVDGALVLPGGSTRSNNLMLPTSVGDEIEMAGAVSIEFWFSQSARQSWSKLFYFGHPAGASADDGMEFCPYKGDGSGRSKLEIIVDGQVAAWGGNYSGDASPIYDLNTMYHVVGIFDQEADRITLYSDGAFSGEHAFTGSFANLNLSELRLGASVGWNDDDFAGRIDEFRIWDGALSDSEITAHFAAGPDQDFNAVASAQEAALNFRLNSAYPNPFNPATTIRYSLSATSELRLSVHDLAGREVALLHNGLQEAGEHEQSFVAGSLPSGVYFLRLQNEGAVATQKLLLVK